jgi:hypothetical protein
MRIALRRAAPWAAAIGLLLAVAGPVAADRPARGCPNDAKILTTIEEMREISLSVGIPPELLGADWEAFVLAKLDRNGDGLFCVQDKPDNHGHLDGWIFNGADNTANH